MVSTLLLAGLTWPAPAWAQEDCVKGGNQHTRGADVEFAFASRRDDPQTKEERYTRALEKLQQSFAQDPNEPRAWLLAGQAYLGLRQWAQADSALDRLVELAPKCEEQARELRFGSWAQQYNLGIARWQSGDAKGALEAFETANVILTDARSLVNAASLHQTAGDMQEAEALYREALAVGGEADMMRAASINLANVLLEGGRAEEAVAIYREYSEKNPDDVLGRLNYAVALMDSGSPEQAQSIFRELLARSDLTFAQWYEVGVGLYRAGDYKQAATAFQRAHELQPYNKEALENLANSWYQAGEYAELVPLAQKLVAEYPYETVHYALLANAHRELGREDDALAVLQRRDALSFEFLRVQLVAPEEGSAYTVEGEALNRTAPAGSKAEVPFEFLGAGGGALLSETLILELAAEGESSAFQLQIQASEPIAGFRYRLAGASASGS